MAAGYSCLLALLSICMLAAEGTSRYRVIAAVATQPEPSLADPDRACAGCHRDIYERYQLTPMARASGVAAQGLIEGGFTHTASGIRYRLVLRDGQAWMLYDRTVAGTGPELHGDQLLSYYIGSGRRGRTYLFEKDGFWFEAPVNYYSKKKLWDMAPNYGSATSMPDTLPVDSNCLHCHASEVQTALPQARNRYPGAPFKAAGVTCASCHGDPAQHIAQKGQGPIVNPAKLSPVKRDSVCLQCHLEGDATIYRAAESLAAYRAGDDLSDFAVYFVDARKTKGGGRATSQYEALLQSACKKASGDKLTCTTCHDPHGSPTPEERVSFYRTKCLACHTGEKMAKEHHPEEQDCAICHMPSRDTTDISHEQLTDHDIQRHPRETPKGQAEQGVELVAVGSSHAGDRELGLAYAQLAASGDRQSGEKALVLLKKAESNGASDADLHVRLGFLDQISGRQGEAEREYKAALAKDPHETTALANLAVIEAAQGNLDAAVKLLETVVADDPSQTAAGLNLAFLECRLGEKALALQTVNDVTRFNPDSPAAHELLQYGRYGGQICRIR